MKKDRRSVRKAGGQYRNKTDNYRSTYLSLKLNTAVPTWSAYFVPSGRALNLQVRIAVNAARS